MPNKIVCQYVRIGSKITSLLPVMKTTDYGSANKAKKQSLQITRATGSPPIMGVVRAYGRKDFDNHRQKRVTLLRLQRLAILSKLASTE